MNKNFHKIYSVLTGISGIVVTPFNSKNSIKLCQWDLIIEKAITASVDSLVVNGNTSEFYSLNHKETYDSAKAVQEKVAGRVPVINGVGRNLKEACETAKFSREIGIEALMVHQPPDPFVSPRGTVQYVALIAEAAQDLPIILYIRNSAIGEKTILELVNIPNVVGVKWANTDLPLLAKLIQHTQSQPIVWVCGLAEIWAPSMYALGAQGFTSGFINIFPEHSVKILQALRKANYEEANKLIDEIREFETIRSEELNGTNVTGVKAALQLMGHDCGAVRPPGAWPLQAYQQERMSNLLKKMGLLSVC